jgi:hypothetical protein
VPIGIIITTKPYYRWSASGIIPELDFWVVIVSHTSLGEEGESSYVLNEMINTPHVSTERDVAGNWTVHFGIIRSIFYLS